MPLDLHIIRTEDFVRAGPQGAADLETSKQLLSALAKTCVERGIHGALLDLRAVPFGPVPVFTPVQLEEVLKVFFEAGFSRAQRLAVCYHADPHHRIRIFAFIGKQQGLNVRAFDRVEEAICWLALGDEALAQAEPAGTRSGGAREPGET